MSKIIWLLSEQVGIMYKTYGAVSNEKTSEKWCELKPKNTSDQSNYNFRQSFTIDDPELLNRIAKEGEKK